LCPEAAAGLQAALTALAKPDSAEDLRTVAERQGDALADLIDTALASGKLPETGGEKPHLLVTVSLETLQTGIGAATLDTGSLLTPAQARCLSCDSGIIPVVLGSESEILDVGRLHRYVTTSIRRALHLRDGGCAHPGCARPATSCDAHHITHWADGGITSLDNMVLLCGRHHRLIHHTDWEIRIHNGRPEFIPPEWLDPSGQPRINLLHRPPS
jgi:hypothetical protein